MTPKHYKSFAFWLRFELLYVAKWIAIIFAAVIIIGTAVPFYLTKAKVDGSSCADVYINRNFDYSTAPRPTLDWNRNRFTPQALSNPNAPRISPIDCPLSQYVHDTSMLSTHRKRLHYSLAVGLILGGYSIVSLTRLSKQTHIWYYRRRYYSKNGHPLVFSLGILNMFKWAWQIIRPILLAGIAVSVSIAVFGFSTTSHDAFVLVFYVPLMFAGTVIFIKIVAAFTNRPELPQAEATPDTIQAVDINFGGLVYTDDGVLVPHEALEDYMQQQARTDERLISRIRNWLQLGTVLRILAFLAIVVTMMWAIGRLLTGNADLRFSLMSLFWLTALAIVVGGNYIQRWIRILSEYYHYWRYTPQFYEELPSTDTFLAMSDGEFFTDEEILNEEPFE